MSDYLFDAAEQDRIKTEFKAIGNERLPPDRKPVGCGLLLLVPPILMLGPQLPRSLAAPMAIVSALVALGGAYFTLFGSSKEQSEIRRRARLGLDALARFHELSADERRTAALRALAYARYDRGPVSYALYDAKEEAARITDALPYVRAVEAVLVAESMMYPVFTA